MLIIFHTLGVMLRTDDAGRWTMDAGPSTPYYMLTGELEKLKPNFGRFKANLTLKIKVKVTSFRTRPRPLCDHYMIQVEDKIQNILKLHDSS